MQPSPPLLQPSIIELRYDNRDKYTQAVRTYHGLLRSSYEDSVGECVHTFRVGQSRERDYKDVLLRLTCEPSHLEAADGHTVIYWKVPGTVAAELDAVDTDLQRGQWTSVEGPASYDVQPRPPGGGETLRSLLRNKDTGDVLGITINPPVPTLTVANPEFIKRLLALLGSYGFASESGLRRLLWSAIATGVVLLGLMFGLGWWWRGTRGR